MDMIEKFNKGDPAAEKAIFELFFKRLVAFAFRWTSNTMDAQDIAIVSMNKLFSIANRDFNDLGKVRTFLYLVTRNACIDQVRKNKLDDRGKKEYHHRVETSEEIDDKLELEQMYDEQLEIITRSIEELTPRRKLVIKYLIIDFKQPAEIARLMGIHISKVYEHRSEFKKCLFKKYGIDGDSLPF